MSMFFSKDSFQVLSHKLCGGVQPLPLKLSCLLAPAPAGEMLGCGRGYGWENKNSLFSCLCGCVAAETPCSWVGSIGGG